MAQPTDPFDGNLDPQSYHLSSSLTYQWDVATLEWIKGTQPGGGSSAVTIADGADVAQGTTTDPAWVAGAGTVIALLKKIASAGGGAVSIADGADVVEGTLADAAVITDAAGTVSGKLRGLIKWAFERMPAALGQTTMAASLPVAIASNQSAVPVSGTVTANQGTAGTAWETVGDVALDAAAAAINPVLIGTYASAAAPADVSADNDAVRLWALRNGSPVVNLASGGALVTVGSKTSANSIPVVVASDQGNVPVSQATAASLNAEVQGDAAQDAAVSGNPVLMGGRASTAHPTAMSADGDAVDLWATRSGSPVVTMAPHIGLAGTGSPWTLTSKTAQYTTTQTSTVLVAGGASEKLVVTSIQIQVGGTTAGTLQVYFGTGAYSRGTSLAIFDGEFAPSSTLKPGVVMQGPFISATNGDDILVTTSAAINPLTITVWYYVVT